MIPLCMFGALFSSSRHESHFGPTTIVCASIGATVCLIGAGICGFNGLPSRDQPILTVMQSKAFQDSVIQPLVAQKTQEVLRELSRGLSPSGARE